ncbi:HEAT repeat domain-containing protein [Botrimarina sp.]|uniref:HEAT repeat domain-containing protein n=1 Tax=Botrimarina sp. TaxID=2795802 RepID=UPI0032F070EC
MNPPAGIETTLRALLRSANPAAADLLAVALGSPDERFRVGAVRALARRDDPRGHRVLVERYTQLAADIEAALADTPPSAPLAGGLRRLIDSGEGEAAEAAARLAEAWPCDELLPCVVRAARAPDAAAMARRALRMARRVAAEVDRYRAGQTERDPAFLRRAAANELCEALIAYGEHRHGELIEALLALAAPDEPALWATLADPSAAGHQPLLDALTTTTDPNALAAIGRSLVDQRAPRVLARIAGARHDAAALRGMLARMEDPIGASARESCARIERLAWLDEEQIGVLLELDGRGQSVAIQVATASAERRTRVAAAIGEVLRAGAPEGRKAACRAIAKLPSQLAIEPLGEALGSDDPAVVAAAAGLLRRKDYPQATTKLVALLDHPSAAVRAAARRSLEGVSFAAFRDHYRELPEEHRRPIGRMIARADSLSAPTLRAELGAGAARRRLDALELLDVMGLRLDLLDELVAAALDPDAGVRCEAVRLLAECPPEGPVVEVLQACLTDRTPSVRAAAERALAALGAAAESLSEET